MNKKQRQDAMRSMNHRTWLIVQDRVDELVFHVELAPRVDLEQILAITIEQFREHGWTIEGTPSFAGFFCNRDGERWFIHITRYNPTRRTRAWPRFETPPPRSRLLGRR
jgi:hypothetical protein